MSTNPNVQIFLGCHFIQTVKDYNTIGEKVQCLTDIKEFLLIYLRNYYIEVLKNEPCNY